MGDDGKKHYITLFMAGEISETSAPLENMEPHKCVAWNWVSWEELRGLLQHSRDRLFDPMIHFLEGMDTDNPVFLDCKN
jgi:hypothetical protein